MAQLLPDVVFRLLDSSANPISGGTATFYLTGTSTLTPIYSDATLATELPNPISTNSGGLFINGSNAVTAIYTNDSLSYRAVFKDASGTTIRDIDPVFPSSSNPYGTRTQMTALSISASQLAVNTTGYSTAGVGAAEYVRTSLATITAAGYPAASYFRSLDRYMPDGTTDATNGGYWLFSGPVITPQAFGAIGDGSTDDTTAINAALSVVSIRGGGEVVFPGGTYKYLHGNGDVPDDNITSDDVTITGYGASIVGYNAAGLTPNNTGSQYYRVFQATGRTNLNFKGISFSGYTSPVALYSCNKVGVTDIRDNGQLATSEANVLTITGITKANPGVVTYTGTDPTEGEYYTLASIGGMVELEEMVIRIGTVNTGAKTFTIKNVDNADLNTTSFTTYTSGGTATLVTNWLRDKGIYLNQCNRVTISNSHFTNLAFSIYCIGDQVSVRCEQVVVSDCTVEIATAFGSYAALFPVGVYFVDIQDGIVESCTFKNIYSSVNRSSPSTGYGIGYGVYQGDGASKSVIVANNTFTFEDAGNRASIPLYFGETTSAAMLGNTFNIASGASILAVARLAAKSTNTHYNIANNSMNILTTKTCYGLYVSGLEASAFAPIVRSSNNIIVGGTNAVRIEFLGNGAYAFSNDEFTDQLGSGVFVQGALAIPQKRVSFNGVSILRSYGRAVDASYCVAPVFVNCTFLDGNLGAASGDNSAAVLLASTCQGIVAYSNVVGNRPGGAGGFVYGFANGGNASSRIFKDITGGNTFLGLSNGAQWLRFNTTSPVTGIYDLEKNDYVQNSDLDAGEAPGWFCVRKNNRALISNASSASTTVNSSTSSLVVGDPVLLIAKADAYDATYNTAASFHQTTVASITDANNFVMTDAIPGGETYVAGTAKVVTARFKAAAVIAA